MPRPYIFFYVLSDISEVSSPITLCIFKVYFLSLKHHILGSTMLLIWLTEFPKLALVQTQISNISLLQECYSTPICQLFLSDLPVEAFYPPLRKLGPLTCIISHIPGFVPSCSYPGSPPSNVMNSWASGHILFPYIINLSSGYIVCSHYSALFYDNFCYYFLQSKNHDYY